MKVIIELTSLDEIKTVVAALEGRNTQAAMALVSKQEPTVTLADAIQDSLTPKSSPMAAMAQAAKPGATRTRRTKAEIQAAAEAAEAPPTEEVAETKNDDTGAEAAPASTVEPREGDIDDATMREAGGKLLREMNANGKDGVGELTKILSSLSSKKVTEVPMNLRPRFIAKVNEALA